MIEIKKPFETGVTTLWDVHIGGTHTYTIMYYNSLCCLDIYPPDGECGPQGDGIYTIHVPGGVEVVTDEILHRLIKKTMIKQL